MFQVLSRWLCYNTIKLCSAWGCIILQASLFPTFQGKGQLQPSDQVRINEASSCSCAGGLNISSLIWYLLVWLYLLFSVFSFQTLRFPLEGVGKTWFCFLSFLKKLLPSALSEHVCRVWLIDGFQTPKIVKWLEEFQLQILDAISASYLCIWFCHHILRGKIVS